MKIKLINPNTTASVTTKIGAVGQAAAMAGTEVVSVNPSTGPVSIEGYYDEAVATIGMLEEIRSGDSEGVDGYIVGCFADIGLLAAREATTKPVVGMAEASMRTVGFVAPSFSIVTPLARSAGRMWALVRDYGAENICRSVRAANCAVLDLEIPGSTARQAVLEQCRRATEEDGAEAILLGAAGMADLVAYLSDNLDVMIVDPIAPAVKSIELLVGLNWGTTKTGQLAFPRSKQYTGHLSNMAFAAAAR